MDAFFSHTQELLSQGYVQVLIGFYVAAQAWWWLRVAIAARYKRFQGSFPGKYAVIVVAYRPDPTRLSRTLKSIVMYGSPAEIIVAIDDATKAPKKLKTIAAKYATKVIEASERYNSRELYAKAAAALKKQSDIIITVAPGAVWDESTPHILTPFVHDDITAVSGREISLQPKSFVHRLAIWLNQSYFSVIMPFQSVLSSVRPLSPHILAVRRDTFAKIVVENRQETFLGRQIFTSFHESLSAHIISTGGKTVYQESAVVNVPLPETFAGLRKTYMQRYRGTIRSLIRHGVALRKAHPLVSLSAVFSLLSPIMYGGLLVATIFIAGYGTYGTSSFLTNYEVIALCSGVLVLYLAASYARHYATVRSMKTAVWLPLFVLVGGVILLWAKIVALWSFTENAPHSKIGTSYGEGKVGRARTAAAICTTLLFAITLPVAYLVLLHGHNVPLSVIANQQGRPYTMAREYSERLRDTDANNDPNASELTNFIRANGAYYGQDVSDAVAERALLCVRDALKVASLHGALDATQACYAQALTVAQDTDPHSHIKDNEVKKPLSPIVKVTAKDGDTLTWLIRAEVKKLDTKKELSAAQAVYIETTYLSQIGQLDHFLDDGEQIELNIEILDALANGAEQLSAGQLAAWGHYAQNIVW